MFEHIDMLAIGIQLQPYTVIPPIPGSDFGILGHFEADSNLKLLPASIFNIYTVFEHINMLSIGIQLQPYTVYPL